MFMAEVDPRDKTVKVRLKGEVSEALQNYAEELQIPLSTLIRMLAWEAYQARQQSWMDESERRKQNKDAFRRQLGGN